MHQCYGKFYRILFYEVIFKMYSIVWFVIAVYFIQQVDVKVVYGTNAKTKSGFRISRGIILIYTKFWFYGERQISYWFYSVIEFCFLAKRITAKKASKNNIVKNKPFIHLFNSSNSASTTFGSLKAFLFDLLNERFLMMKFSELSPPIASSHDIITRILFVFQ